MKFKLHSKYKPTGDQPEAIDEIVNGLEDGLAAQVLKGVTGSGKTFTMANIIERVQRPALVLAHNKTLAAQLCNEFREFFPENRVEFFVSYYDYYQPEAYLPSTDTYIEKDLAINDEIDKLRHSATCSLHERRDTIVVASVSCIYGLGAPEEYYRLALSVRPGDKTSREALIARLTDINYKRNDLAPERTNFRVRGDTVDIFPASMSEHGIRVEFFGNEIDGVCEFDIVSGNIVSRLDHAAIFPASHYAVEHGKMLGAIEQIEKDRQTQVEYFTNNNKLIEAQRIGERVRYDVEMMKEIGYCSGIENYSRYFDGRKTGEPPFTLLDYFPHDFVLFIDESHMTIPQIRAMYRGDLSRKTALVDYGFRLPAAYDNRPLKFDEFRARIGQTVYVSATPASYEHVADFTPDGACRSARHGASHKRSDRRLAYRDKIDGYGRRTHTRNHAHKADGGKPYRLFGGTRHKSKISSQRYRHNGTRHHNQFAASRRFRRFGRYKPFARRTRYSRGSARRHSRRG